MATMKQRRGTASQWTAVNPVLAAGEIGFEIDSNSVKIGNGLTRWDDLDYLNDSAVQDLVDSGRLSEESLNAAYGTKAEVQALDERTAPQKIVRGLPVPPISRPPNLAIMDVVPTPEFSATVIRAEGELLWAQGRDNSLYKAPDGKRWEHVSYHPAGMQLRGGLTRCKDGSLLLFTVLFNLQRSTDEGITWTEVLPRRVKGLEPLTTQSIAVHGETGHVFYGEYTVGTPADWPDVVLWRSTDHGATWQQFYSWPMNGVPTDHPERIRHIHGVQYDPIAKDIYVMSGDSSLATGIWKVQGETCVPVLTNAQLAPVNGDYDSPRAVGMMFFPDYIAWGSDSTSSPFLYRIRRDKFGTDPSALERGPRMSSTSWGTARASEDGARWAMFASDEGYPSPNGGADRMAHIYAVEDQGATVYEVAAISSQTKSGTTTLQPCGPAESFRDHFWFNMRTGDNARPASWKARIRRSDDPLAGASADPCAANPFWGSPV